MTDKKIGSVLTKLDFKLTYAGDHGIYRHEYCENEAMRFVLIIDKCYFESCVYGKSPGKVNGSILEIARAAIGDENYLLFT